jgi:2-isopropylmalate synthase
MEPSVEVSIFDTTERDGAQALSKRHQFKKGKKPEIANHIARLGVGVIEAGFPATPGDAEEVAEVARTVGRKEYAVSKWVDGVESHTHYRSPIIAGLSRVALSDIEVTWEAINSADNPRIHTFISTDPEHMIKKFPGKSPEDVLSMGMEAITLGKQLSSEHPWASLEFSAEAATTTEMKYLERVIKEALLYGADVINVPDTVGQRDPLWMLEFYSTVIGWVMDTNPNATISAHNHNDLGNAVANTHMLVVAATKYAEKHGVNVKIQLETTICGFGERAGNADVFPVVANMFKFAPEMPAEVSWEFNPVNSVDVATRVLKHARMKVDPKNPIVGSDINIHRSGIHSDGVIKGGHKLYTPFDPEFWGHSDNAIHEAGRYQGRRGNEAANRSIGKKVRELLSSARH